MWICYKIGLESKADPAFNQRKNTWHISKTFKGDSGIYWQRDIFFWLPNFLLDESCLFFLYSFSIPYFTNNMSFNILDKGQESVFHTRISVFLLILRLFKLIMCCVYKMGSFWGDPYDVKLSRLSQWVLYHHWDNNILS